MNPTPPPAGPAPRPPRHAITQPSGTPKQPPPPAPPPWRPLPGRLRLGLWLLAAVVAVTILWEMLQPKLALMAARQARGEAPVPIGLPTEVHQHAAASAAEARRRATAPTVGGKMEVLVLPAPAAAASGAR